MTTKRRTEGMSAALMASCTELVPTPRRRRPVRLATLRDVVKELAHLYRQVDAGNMPSDEGTRRAYLLYQLRGAMEAQVIEDRLGSLERTLNLD